MRIGALLETVEPSLFAMKELDTQLLGAEEQRF
jgi:hypothetical protein